VSPDLLDASEEYIMYTNFTKLLRPRAAIVLPKYFFYCWQMLYDLGRTARYEKQPTNIKNFKLDDFLAHETLAFPVDLKAQEAIVTALDSIHLEVATLERMLNHLLSIRHAAFKELLTGGRQILQCESDGSTAKSPPRS
jgi:hypothetical protein